MHDEIVNIYELSESKGFNLGESLYKSSFHFVDLDLLVDNSMQNRIKEYNFCKQFSCPPCPSLQETPAIIIEQFSVIEEEYNLCIKKHQEEKNA